MSLPRLRLLAYTTLFPSPAAPTHGLFVRNRLASVSELADVTVIAPVNAGRNPAALFTPRRRRDPAGFEVHHPRFAVLPGLLKRWDAALLFGETYPQLDGLSRRGAFDLVDAHYAYPDGAAAARLARALGIPFVLTVRGSDLEVVARERGRRESTTATLRKAAAVVAVSGSLARRAIELGTPEGRVHVIPNGVDTSLFRPLDRGAARESLGLAPDRRLVLAVGRIDPVKGLDLLIDSLARLAAQGVRDVDAIVIGEGDARNAMERRAADAGVAARIGFRGAVAPEELPVWYAAADLVTLLSRSEGCPNVVLEALACGRPVVATAVGGIPDLLREGESGFLVRERDPADVASRWEEALARTWDPAAIVATLGNRTWSAVAREQVALCRAVLDEAGRARP